MKALSAFALVLALAVGCATLHSEAAAILRVDCNVPDAAVMLDDHLIGKAADLKKEDKSIRPGFYRVEIQHPGYHSYFTEINVAEGGVAAVKAELHPLLD
jgi:PEGA domain